MGGWNSKGKREAGNRLSVFWLKKHGYLNRECSHNSGGIKWTSGYGNESSIGFSVVKDDWGKPEERAYINLQYTHINRDSSDKESMDYRVELVTTPCRYGGRRYWFICPLSKSGRYCGRRVGMLFSIGKWFGCRHCGDLTYSSRNQSGGYKGFVSIPDIERAEKEVKRCYYRGKPTRRYRRVIRLNEKFENGYIRMLTRLGTLDRFANLKK